MPRELVPELHDVLKLTKLKHDFSDFDSYREYAPDTPTWRGVLQHHCNERSPKYPTDRDTFLLHMADGLASNFSRHDQAIRKEEEKETEWSIHCLWRPRSAASDKRLSQPEAIKDMLAHLRTDPSFEEVYARYKEIFESRAEDAYPGMNITTLATHARLTGAFYRFLRDSQLFHVSEDEVADAAKRGFGAVGQLREQKARQWQVHLIRCRPRVLTSPFRVRDLNIFGSLQNLMEKVSETYTNNVLFLSTDEFLLYSDELGILDGLRDLAGSCGVKLQLERTLAQLTAKDMLAKLMPDRKGTKLTQDTLYPEPEAAVSPPLCEICQMRQATRIWPDDYLATATEPEEQPQGKDHLCETCFSIRSRPSKLKKLAHWEEWGEGDLIWARFGLDFPELHETLGQLYLDYLRSLDARTPQSRAEVRFSLVAEFQKDYEKYLAELRSRLLRQFGEDRTETVLPDFFCVKAETGKEVFDVLRCFHEASSDFFPAFFTTSACPLRVSVAFCSVKYPFFEVWRRWQEQKSELEITAVGHGGLQLEAKNLERFLQLADPRLLRKTALHNLAEISRISQQLAELRFRARGEKGERQTFEHLSEFLPLGLTFDGILTLAKLMGD